MYLKQYLKRPIEREREPRNYCKNYTNFFENGCSNIVPSTKSKLSWLIPGIVSTALCYNMEIILGLRGAPCLSSIEGGVIHLTPSVTKQRCYIEQVFFLNTQEAVCQKT